MHMIHIHSDWQEMFLKRGLTHSVLVKERFKDLNSSRKINDIKLIITIVDTIVDGFGWRSLSHRTRLDGGPGSVESCLCTYAVSESNASKQLQHKIHKLSLKQATTALSYLIPLIPLYALCLSFIYRLIYLTQFCSPPFDKCVMQIRGSRMIIANQYSTNLLYSQWHTRISPPQANVWTESGHH